MTDSPARFAVLIPIVDHGGEECALLTLRNPQLQRYAGQVSLPGGAREPGDENLLATALRETFEEVGIPAHRVEILAELDDFETGHGDRVRPFAGRVRGACPVAANPVEVARILHIPVALLRRDPFGLRGTFRDDTGRTHQVHTFTFDGAEVWGLTARILRCFFVPGHDD